MCYNDKRKFMLDDNALISYEVSESDLAHFTGVHSTHIFSHSLNKIVCGSKSHFFGGINDDLNLEIIKMASIERFISCKSYQKWFKKHYLK